MKPPYRITKRYGKYYNTFEATLYKRFKFLGICIYLSWEITRGKSHFVNDTIAEWLDEYRLGWDDIKDLT